MKKLSLIFIIIMISEPAMIAGAAEFGNMAIYLDKSITEDFSRMSIQLEGEPMVRYFDKNREMIFWDIYPGHYDIQLAFPDDRGAVSVKAEVLPGLTSKIIIRNSDGKYLLHNDGFADQGGHILTFDRNEINSMPGELSDGLGILAPAGRDSVRYSYEGLNIAEETQGRVFAPNSKTMPDLALVNISDPFAGYGDENISLINNYLGPEKMGGEYTYGTRDQRYYRVVARHELPRGVGSAFGALSFDNLGDADPKWNVDCRLPHNGAENVELLGGIGFNILTRFKSDVSIYYKSIKRDYYEHAYYFDYVHSPREELNAYGGDLSVSGWLMKDLFMNVRVGISGDESRKGDGKFFDNLTAYDRTISNPSYDPHYLFYAWDDMEEITDTLDESHYYSVYSRYQTREKKAFVQLKKQFSDNIEVWSDVQYSVSTFRKYVSLDATQGYSASLVDVIGFDSLGDETTENNYFADIPHPKKLNLSIGAKIIDRKYFVKGTVDYYRFDPGALVFRDPLNPLDPDGIDDYDLEAVDMKETEVNTDVGFRFSGGYSLRNSLDLFANAVRTYEYPSYDSLYVGFEFLESRISAGSYYPFPNANLSSIKHTQLESGLRFTTHDNSLSLSYQYRRSDGFYGFYHFSAIPYSYDMLENRDVKGTENALVLSYQYSGKHFINTALYGEVVWRKWDRDIVLRYYHDYNIAWSNPASIPASSIEFDTYKLGGTFGLHPGNLNLDHDRLYAKILSRLGLNISFDYKSGLRYTKMAPYDEVSFGDAQVTPVSPFFSEKARHFFEVNLALSARVADFRGASMSLCFEVLNLLDRDNFLDVYDATGRADYDAYDQTIDYDLQATDENIYDNSGLTFAEKYALRLNDPNNYSRPRLLRILARLEF
ncbi:MAG: hypothetical protein CVT49_07355 [candidate division Zixibacteria bacterium HGW-Zixibacteria-1]|nr:MAG: hypothetical protein CVT49_07355 [candidate division Zixibacteria bacterium HGW-Zixibacteria-1]